MRLARGTRGAPLRLGRALRFAGHLALTTASFAWFCVARRRATLVFNHEPDLGTDGRDRQMGPLVDALRARKKAFLEITWVGLDGGLLWNLRAKRRPFLSYAVLIALARLLEQLGLARDRARLLVGRALLAALVPHRLFLIDESGSGQLLVRAARSLGIHTLGLQHGDFQPTNPQYERSAVQAKGIVPVDTLCLWSPWFQRRLLSISPIYAGENTRITGRLRYPVQASSGRSDRDRRCQVLLVSEARGDFALQVQPFLDALSRSADFALRVQPHPAEPEKRWPDELLSRCDLDQALLAADVVLGVSSSALLEALVLRRPAVCLARGAFDPAGYAAEAVVEVCPDPAALESVCRTLAGKWSDALEDRRERVWGGVPPCASDAILDLLDGDCSTPVG